MIETQEPSRTGVHHLLALEVRDGPLLLARVLALLQRRRCRIVSVEYLAGDRHAPARLVVGIDAPSMHAHCVEPWLRNLVDVVDVEQIGP